MAARLAALVLLVALINGSMAATARPAADCVDSTIASYSSVNTFPRQFQLISSQAAITQPTFTYIGFAKDFEVTYYNTFKVVRNLRQNNDTYVLYQCGMAPPTLPDTVPATAKVFSVPLSSVSVSDTSIIAFMKLLGVRDRISYTSQYAVDACMQSLGYYGCNKIAQYPSSYMDANTTAMVAAQSQQVDAFLGYSYNKDPKAVAVTATPDPGVLNRAEWIKFVAMFFNKEAEANALFDTIATTYNSLKAAAASATANGQRKLVAWLYYQPENPAWGIYGRANYQISFTAYKTQYAVDAGGRNLDQAATIGNFSNGNDVVFSYGALTLYNMATAPATLKAILKDVDVIIDEARYPDKSNADVHLADFMSLYGFTAADVPNLKFLRDSAILREDVGSNPDSYTDWFEMAVARPDLVLQDLIRTITPSALSLTASNAAGSYLRNIAAPATLLSAQSCPIPGCAFTVAPICPYVMRTCDGSITFATNQQRCTPDCTATANTTAPATTNTTTPSTTPATNTPAPVGSGASSLTVVRPVVITIVALLALAAVAVLM